MADNFPSADEIAQYRTTRADAAVFCYDSVGSTNDVARELALKNACSGTIVASRSQQSGRGRRGHSFFSPYGGIYMSVVLRPPSLVESSALITPAAAVAGSRAIEKVSGKRVRIKWVNDIFIEGKKVCGILAESGESSCGAFAILGVGVNVSMPRGGFPDEIADIAGALFAHGDEAPDTRARLIAEIADGLCEMCEEPDITDFLDEYRVRALLLGEQIDVIASDGVRRRARAIEIDDLCRLVAEYPNGEREALCAGEVSARRAP
ncbi:MAG: biotin--[acetyl-CoA-carboxylase] ligase [Oscillospiraceae bacterium]